MRVARGIHSWHEYGRAFALDEAEDARADHGMVFASFLRLRGQRLRPWEPILHSRVIRGVEVNSHAFVAAVLGVEFRVKRGAFRHLCGQDLFKSLVEFGSAVHLESAAD